MSKSKIYIHEWLQLKPYQTQTITDGYYLKLCNKVKQTLLSSNESIVLHMYLDQEQITLFACYLTSWFEDLISGTNIWNAFVKKHKLLYNKPLPFYNLEEYFEDEINPQDISFLIWYFINTAQDEKFISPFNDFIEVLTNNIFDLFEVEWEYAPENTLLHSIYQIDKDADYYTARNLIDKVLFKTYLFYTDTQFRLYKGEIEILDETKDEPEDRVLTYLNEMRDTTLLNSFTRLLSLKGKEWVAEMLGHDHPLYNDYLNISQRIRAYFLYKGQNENDIFLEHIATGRKFNLTKKSFDHSHDLIETDTIIFIGMVKWQNEWWFSGVYFYQKFDADLVLDERNSMESRMALNFLDFKVKEVSETLEEQFKAFKEFNDGQQIAFMPSNEIMAFNKDYISSFNESLKLSDIEIEEAKQRRNKDGFFERENEDPDFSEVSESGLVFFNSKSGIEIALAVNSAFPLPNNPYFEKVESEDHIFRLLMDESLSTELAIFCVENCKSKLPFFKKGVGKKYLKDIDFLLRFWKVANYHSKPEITLV